MLRGALLIALVALLAGCGSARTATPTTTTATTTAGHVCKARVASLVVAVIDGDTLRRVSGARVRLLHQKETTNRRGVVVFRGPKRRLTVAVSARHYTAARVRLNFWHRIQTIRIYQPRLQWPLLGTAQCPDWEPGRRRRGTWREWRSSA